MRILRKMKKLLQRLFTIKDLFGGRLAISKAELNAVVFRADGSVENLGVIAKKKVTDVFVKDICDALADAAGSGQLATFNDYKFHDCGTGTTAEDNGQTGLVTPYGGARASGTQVSGGAVDARTYESVGTISFTSSLAITEHGLFNASSGGLLMDRSVFSAINVNNGDSIQFTYTLTINAEA